MPQLKHEPTVTSRRTVSSMAAYGIPQKDIAAVIGITKPTLEKYYRHELDVSSAKATAKVAETLYAKATAKEITGPSVTAALFWLKTRGGWRETDRLEVTGKNGGAIQHEHQPVTLDVSKLSTDALIELRGALLLASDETHDQSAPIN